MQHGFDAEKERDGGEEAERPLEHCSRPPRCPSPCVEREEVAKKKGDSCVFAKEKRKGKESHESKGMNKYVNGDQRGISTRSRRRLLLTGMRSAYFCRMRSASAFRFSKGCSSLNLDRIVDRSFGSFVSLNIKKEGKEELSRFDRWR